MALLQIFSLEMRNTMTYQDAVDYIENIPQFAKKTTLENSRQMLKLLGNPERHCQVIHVAGTNGKGSVCAFLASVLERTGKKVGMFTSPHLIDIEERIQINHENAGRDKFAAACEEMIKIGRELSISGFQHPAYFEFLFGMAMYLFGQEKVDIIILETGLGGRLDATNAVEKPAVSVITSIGLDHMEVLGDTITQIASEKAGIIKEGVPVVYWGQNPEASAVIEEKAARKHSEIIKITEKNYKILKINHKNIDFCSFSRYYENSIFTLPFSASYQAANASLALAALGVLDREHKITLETAADGLKNVRWPGRMEEVLPGIFVDGAHNESGIWAFIEAVQGREASDGKYEKYLLFSAVKEKDYEKMARLLCENLTFKGIVVTEINGGRKVPFEILKNIFKNLTDTPVYGCSVIEEAFLQGRMLKGPEDALYCVGSLYLAGAVKQIIRDKEVTE